MCHLFFRTSLPRSTMKGSLVIFLISIGVFFWMTYTLPTGFKDYPEETVQAAIFKCIPVATLMFMVYSSTSMFGEHDHLKTNMLWGLFFSMAGDFCLIWRHTLFLHGASFFAVAHVFYIRGFRTSPLGLGVGILCIGSSVGNFFFFLPDLINLELKVVAGAYGLLVASMGWRALVHWQQMQTTGSLLAVLGAVSFNISDFTILLDHAKYIAQVPYASVIIMVTYYAAQLGLCMSVLMYEPPKYKKLR